MNPYQTPTPTEITEEGEGITITRADKVGLLENPFFWIITILLLLAVSPFVPIIVSFANSIF